MHAFIINTEWVLLTETTLQSSAQPSLTLRRSPLHHTGGAPHPFPQHPLQWHIPGTAFLQPLPASTPILPHPWPGSSSIPRVGGRGPRDNQGTAGHTVKHPGAQEMSESVCSPFLLLLFLSSPPFNFLLQPSSPILPLGVTATWTSTGCWCAIPVKCNSLSLITEYIRHFRCRSFSQMGLLGHLSAERLSF